METTKELVLLNELLNFKVPIISEKTRFWMVRTQKGYFYSEFISKNFVALAWNNIDQKTNFSDQNKEYLKDEIVMNFKEINRPSTVINKCYNFINEVSAGDILLIPSKGSRYITFAVAGDYFEDSTKIVELEKTVIYRIQNNDVDINDVSCPYKKRRHISLLRTVSSDDLNPTLYRAMSNYHGLSNLDSYGYSILNELYNCYTFKDYTVLVYNIRKKTPIKPRELSSLIYGNIECLCTVLPEDNISTQMSLHSPGDMIYLLEGAYETAKNGWPIILALLVILGGGKALGFEIHGVIEIIKDIFSASDDLSAKSEDLRAKKLDNDLKELEVYEKKLELTKKLRDSGVDPESLVKPLEAVAKSASSLKAEPIVLGSEQTLISNLEDENEESSDIEDE